MYEIVEYASTNAVGTAMLLEGLSSSRRGRLVVASSMSVYGEGPTTASLAVERRRASRARCLGSVRTNGQPLVPVATPETKPPGLASVYALTKYDQERLCLVFGQAYHLPVVALRFFNAYGPRQALSNPYTGVFAIFASRLLNGKRPLVFEDGSSGATSSGRRTWCARAPSPRSATAAEAVRSTSAAGTGVTVARDRRTARGGARLRARAEVTGK